MKDFEASLMIYKEDRGTNEQKKLTILM